MSAIIVDRFTGVFGLFFLSLITMAFHWGTPAVERVMSTLVVMWAAGLFFLLILFLNLHKKFLKIAERFFSKFCDSKKIKSLKTVFSLYNKNPGAVLKALLLTIIQQILYGASLFFFSRGLKLLHTPSFFDVFVCSPPTFITNILPLPGAGLGVNELVFDFFLNQRGVPGGAVIFFTFRFWLIALSVLIGGTLCFLFKREKKPRFL
jgi:hypothetical protein